MKTVSFAATLQTPPLLPTFLAVMIGLLAPACAQNGVVAVYHETYVSPNTFSHQGYATDGTNHYTFDNGVIYKWRNDQDWTLIASNNMPFAGISQPDHTGLDHFGDGDYCNGKLYLVAEAWRSCTNYFNQSILVFDAVTLNRLEVHNVSAQHHEVAGLGIAPHDGLDGVIYVASYCDGSKLFKYDLQTFEYLGPLPLSQTLTYLQGVAWHDGRFYVPEDGGSIYTFGGDGRVSLLYQDSHSGSHEGLKYVQGQIRWLIDEGPGKKRIHYISKER